LFITQSKEMLKNLILQMQLVRSSTDGLFPHLRGLRTLALRMNRHCESAQALAERLQDNEKGHAPLLSRSKKPPNPMKSPNDK
jgi:Cystathionine beta-lyases/cystathionine gamma-synthases